MKVEVIDVPDSTERWVEVRGAQDADWPEVELNLSNRQRRQLHGYENTGVRTFVEDEGILVDMWIFEEE